MALNAQESALLAAFRLLPPDSAEQLARLAARLASLAVPGGRIEWSDEWSDEDLRDYTAYSTEGIGSGNDPE